MSHNCVPWRAAYQCAVWPASTCAECWHCCWLLLLLLQKMQPGAAAEGAGGGEAGEQAGATTSERGAAQVSCPTRPALLPSCHSYPSVCHSSTTAALDRVGRLQRCARCRPCHPALSPPTLALPQDRLEGILQAIDALNAEEAEGHGQHAQHSQQAKGGTVGKEGPQAADPLTEEALSTMQPGDVMPRPVRARSNPYLRQCGPAFRLPVSGKCPAGWCQAAATAEAGLCLCGSSAAQGEKHLPPGGTQSLRPGPRPDHGPAARLNKT